ncbi:MAG: hypothetical protein SGI73_05025 [Chloroflexota bacterium]|nr:hypothetical protein [Chloroflexota bacterium]
MDDFLRRIFGSSKPHPLNADAARSTDAQSTGAPQPAPDVRSSGQTPAPVHPRVLAIIHDPIMPDGRRIRATYGWNDSDALMQGYSDDIRRASDGYAQYEIVERVVVDGFPVKKDGFRYTPKSFAAAWTTRQFHQPDAVDYLALVREFRLIERVDSGEIDEVWLLGFPYCGYYESIMAGAGAFWCNAPPLAGTEHGKRRFVIMGFNDERGVGEMLEDLGHRAESTLSKVYAGTRGDANLWERFIRYDKTHPGRAECGNVHFAPNSVQDYDWGNPRVVPSRCDTWYAFPDLSGEARRVNRSEWGDGDIRAHHVWWFRHFPHIVGAADGVSWNWWEYVIDPNRVR